MRKLIHITPAPRRVYLCGRHLHHGLDGLVLIIVGIGLALHDRRDFPWRPEKEELAR
jgi:hypothetical protein